MTTTPELNALYQLHRYQILLNAKSPDGEYRFPKGYLYAVAHDVYPLWHESWHTSESDPFESLYHTKKEFIANVMKYVDDLCISKKDLPSFYDLETIYGRENRSSLIRSFRYCYLNRGFDDTVYKALFGESAHPTEASGICMEFQDYELAFL